MEKKEIEMLEKRLGRKVDVDFLRECKNAFLDAHFESTDSEELRSLIGLPLELKIAGLRRWYEERTKF